MLIGSLYERIGSSFQKRREANCRFICLTLQCFNDLTFTVARVRQGGAQSYNRKAPPRPDGVEVFAMSVAVFCYVSPEIGGRSSRKCGS
jgi:hypothetical protein